MDYSENKAQNRSTGVAVNIRGTQGALQSSGIEISIKSYIINEKLREISFKLFGDSEPTSIQGSSASEKPPITPSVFEALNKGALELVLAIEQLDSILNRL